MRPFSKSTPKASAFLPTPPTTTYETPAAYRETKPLPPTPLRYRRPISREEGLASPLDVPIALGFQDIDPPSTRTQSKPATPKIVVTQASDDSSPTSSRTLFPSRSTPRTVGVARNTHPIRGGTPSDCVAKTGKGVYSALLSDSPKPVSPTTHCAETTGGWGIAREESPNHTTPTTKGHGGTPMSVYIHERRESTSTLGDTNHQPRSPMPWSPHGVASAPQTPSASRTTAQPSHPSSLSPQGALGLSHIQSPSLRRIAKRSLQMKGSIDIVNEEAQREKAGLLFSPPTKEECERGRTVGKINPANEKYYHPSYDTEKGPKAALAVQLQTPKSPKRLELDPDTDDRIAPDPVVPQKKECPSWGSPKLAPPNSPQYAEREGAPRLRSKSRVRADCAGGLVDVGHWGVEGREIDLEHLTHCRLQGRGERQGEGAGQVGAPGKLGPCDGTTTRPCQRAKSDSDESGRERCDVRGSSVRSGIGSITTHENDIPIVRRVKGGTEPCQSRELLIKVAQSQMSCLSDGSATPEGTRDTRGNRIDELTMRGLLKLLEQMLDEKQKVRMSPSQATVP